MDKNLLTSGLPLNILFNLILVQHDVRHAMLIEREDIHFLEIAKEHFNDLIYSHYENLDLCIISKILYKNNNFYDNKSIGNILGYPCADDFEDTLKDVNKYGISIDVHLNDGKKCQLFGNMALNLDKLQIFYDISQFAENTLKNHPEVGDLINSVRVTYDLILPKRIICDMVLEAESYDSLLKKHVEDMLYNVGFSAELYNFNFDLKNRLHKGILVSLIEYVINDPLEKYYPLHDEPTEIINWGKSLLNILQNN